MKRRYFALFFAMILLIGCRSQSAQNAPVDVTDTEQSISVDTTDVEPSPFASEPSEPAEQASSDDEPNTMAAPPEWIISEQALARSGIQFKHELEWLISGQGSDVIFVEGNGYTPSIIVDDGDLFQGDSLEEALQQYVEEIGPSTEFGEMETFQVNGQNAVQQLYETVSDPPRLFWLTLIENNGRFALVDLRLLHPDEPTPQSIEGFDYDIYWENVTILHNVFINEIVITSPTGPLELAVDASRVDEFWGIGADTFYTFTSRNERPLTLIVESRDRLLGRLTITVWEWDSANNEWPDRDDVSQVTPLATSAAEEDEERITLEFTPTTDVTYLVAVGTVGNFNTPNGAYRIVLFE